MITTLTLSALMLGAPQATKTLTGTRTLSVCAASTGARFAASMEDNSVRIYNAENGGIIRTLTGHPQPVYGLAFNKAGTLLATGDETARIFIWNLSTGAKVKEFTRVNAHSRGIQTLNFSADGKSLVSTGRDDFMIVWDVASGKPVKKYPGDGANVSSAYFKTGSPAIYAATIGEGVKMWNRSSGATTKLGGHDGRGAVDFVMNAVGSKGLSAGMDNTINAWDLATKKRIGTLKGHEDTVLKVAMSPNGKFAASGSADRTVRIWDLVGYKQIASLTEMSAVGSPVAFTGDGRFLVCLNVNDEIVIRSIGGKSK